MTSASSTSPLQGMKFDPRDLHTCTWHLTPPSPLQAVRFPQTLQLDAESWEAWKKTLSIKTK